MRNVLQICADVRPEQYRGIPLLAPCIESLKQLSRYSEAELTSAIIRSYFSLFFIQNVKDYGVNDILGVKEVDVSQYRHGAGTMNALPVGCDVKTVGSSNQIAFDSFVTNHLKTIGAALNLPYEVLMKNFQSSYSASRAALLQAQSTFNNYKQWFINDFCKPIYEQFLLEAVSIGRIDAPQFFDDPIIRAAWSNAEFYNETSRILDPVKEVNAAILRLSNSIIRMHWTITISLCSLIRLTSIHWWEKVLLPKTWALQKRLPAFIKRHYDVINKVCGGFLILVGILMMTGQLNRMLAWFSA